MSNNVTKAYKMKKIFVMSMVVGLCISAHSQEIINLKKYLPDQTELQGHDFAKIISTKQENYKNYSKLFFTSTSKDKETSIKITISYSQNEIKTELPKEINGVKLINGTPNKKNIGDTTLQSVNINEITKNSILLISKSGQYIVMITYSRFSQKRNSPPLSLTKNDILQAENLLELVINKIIKSQKK